MGQTQSLYVDTPLGCILQYRKKPEQQDLKEKKKHIRLHNYFWLQHKLESQEKWPEWVSKL